MTKRRGPVLVVAWVVTTVAVTLWVTAKSEQEVSFGNALLVGVVAGTAVVAVIAKAKG
ncbi:MAG TPA: hypothetical protein VIL37_10140 [Natronosporangium sp.]